MSYRDLEKVRVIVKEATNIDISYAYDDLVFPDHTAFIIQFTDAESKVLFCYFHVDCLAEEKKKIFNNLSFIASKKQCEIINKGNFKLNQKGEEVEILFV